MNLVTRSTLDIDAGFDLLFVVSLLCFRLRVINMARPLMIVRETPPKHCLRVVVIRPFDEVFVIPFVRESRDILLATLGLAETIIEASSENMTLFQSSIVQSFRERENSYLCALWIPVKLSFLVQPFQALLYLSGTALFIVAHRFLSRK